MNTRKFKIGKILMIAILIAAITAYAIHEKRNISFEVKDYFKMKIE